MKRPLPLVLILALCLCLLAGCDAGETLAENADFALLSLDWDNNQIRGSLRPGADCDSLTLCFVAETAMIFIDAPAVGWTQVSADDTLSFSILPAELDGSYSGVYKGTTKLSEAEAAELVTDAIANGAYSAYLLFNNDPADRLSFDLDIPGH